MSKMNLSEETHKTAPHSELSEARISARQFACLERVALGMTSKEIARELSIAPSTVDNHIKAAVDRLGAKNRNDAARIVLGARLDISALPLKHDTHGDRLIETPTTAEFSLFSLPPIGGPENRSPTIQRIYHIGQIALLSIITMLALVLTIAGVVHVLSM